MSLESGRNLGRIASFINIILPAIWVVIYVGYFLLISSLAFPPITPTPSPIIPSFFGIFFIVAIALGVVSLVGFILFLLAMYRLSRYYKAPSIFNNILYTIIIGIVGGVTLVILTFAFLFASISDLIGGQIGSPTLTFLPIAAIIIMAGVLGIINGVLYMRAFNKLAERSSVDSFHTAGILFLIGAIVPVVSWIAWIIAYIGYGKLQPSAPVPAYTAPSPTAPPYMGPAKRCPNCGADNNPEAHYCSSCGKPI